MPVITVKADTGENLLKALRQAGIFLPAVCGGRGSCGKCSVRIVSGDVPVSGSDKNFFSPGELEDGWRLACTAFPEGNISVQIPETGEQEISSVNSFDNGMATNAGVDADSIFGIAVDIGTTTLGFALVGLRSGGIAARHSAVNRQREWGADVITRILKANSGELSALCRCIRKQIAEGVVALCAEAGIDGSKIQKIAITGNTVMLHILLNLSCETLGQAPFTPVTLDMVFMDYGEIFEGGLSCGIAIMPGISTYVGADITSGLFFTEMYNCNEPAVLMDIGTNGEIALVCGGKILCTATAAGPAFEGGNILWGTGSIPGAISKARFKILSGEEGVFEFDTIGNRPPAGICGSGVVDIVYRGLMNGLIWPDGKLNEKVRDGGIFLTKDPGGRDIIFCQKDVREFQLAKSAIRTGLDTLLTHAGIDYDSIKTLYIAGGFGFNIDMESAAGLGLIPAPLVPKVSLAGNSALGGAVKYLLETASSTGNNETLCNIIKQSEEYNLPKDEAFNDNFIDNLNFARF